MAITTYSELQSAVAYRIGNRNDPDLTTRVPEYISSAEVEMNRLLKTADMEASATLTTTAGNPSVTLPTGFVKARRIRLNWAGSLWPVWPTALVSTRREGVQGVPINIAIMGNALIVKPIPSDAYQLLMDYYARFTPLSAIVPSNWILANHHDAYLNGSIAYGYYATGSLDRGDRFYAMFRASIDAINSFDADKRFTPEILQSDAAWVGRRQVFNIETG